jgi:hypothetical protein
MKALLAVTCLCLICSLSYAGECEPMPKCKDVPTINELLGTIYEEEKEMDRLADELKELNTNERKDDAITDLLNSN